MKTGEMLTTFTLRLTVCGPVFIGSGKTLGKKEYAFHPRTNVLTIYDSQQLLECVVQHDLMDEYEQYILSTDNRDLYKFVWKTPARHRQLSPAELYSIPGGDAILGEDGQPADIRLFQRDAEGQVYVPGSSVKGMLRTAITTVRLLENKPKAKMPAAPRTATEPQEIKKNLRFAQRDARDAVRALDTELFHTLRCDKQHPENAVNSVFRGLSAADSAPIKKENMILCRKLDLHPDGGTNLINLVRECLRPGTVVDVPVTIDHSLAGDLTPDSLLKIIQRFDEHYSEAVLSYYEDSPFPLPELKNHLFLGGGVGLQSKTIAEPWAGKDDSLEYNSNYLQLAFPAHHHEADMELDISPRMLKTTSVDGKQLLFGLCEVELL